GRSRPTGSSRCSSRSTTTAGSPGSSVVSLSISYFHCPAARRRRSKVSNLVRAALVQQRWTGDKDSMIAAAVEHIATAASQGAQVICLQELFYGPYFCQVQDADYYSYTEAIPDGPTTRLLQEVAERHGIVIVAPMYEQEQAGVHYNTAAVIDADGKYLGKYRKNHIPQVKGFWEKFYFRPGNTGYPVF